VQRTVIFVENNIKNGIKVQRTVTLNYCIL
jgi:hypothetical protein